MCLIHSFFFSFLVFYVLLYLFLVSFSFFFHTFHPIYTFSASTLSHITQAKYHLSNYLYESFFTVSKHIHMCTLYYMVSHITHACVLPYSATRMWISFFYNPHMNSTRHFSNFLKIFSLIVYIKWLDTYSNNFLCVLFLNSCYNLMNNIFFFNIFQMPRHKY